MLPSADVSVQASLTISTSLHLTITGVSAQIEKSCSLKLDMLVKICLPAAWFLLRAARLKLKAYLQIQMQRRRRMLLP